MSTFFEEKDFTEYKYHEHERPAHAFARMCNEKLEKALGPVVYLNDDGVWFEKVYVPENEQNGTEARLFNIQEIERECVDHEPVGFDMRKIQDGLVITFGESKCKWCDKKIKPKWETCE